MNLTNFPMSPPQASNFAVEHDEIFYTLTALTVFFTLLVCGLVLFFAIKYRAGNKVDRSRPMYENLKLELTWTIVPMILGLVMFYFGARLFIEMRNPPADAQEVFVIGKQWMWHIEHSNGIRENNTLHVPLGKPIKVTMISQDVLHAFYIPAFRVQMHVVPGRYTTMWFIPTKIGEYHLFCGMYCGTQHSEMGGKVVVMSQSDWAQWAANGGESRSPMTMEQAGARLFQTVGCANCHGDRDTPRAPSLVGIFGSTRSFADGGSAVADQDYIREEILDPHKRITAGYDATMPIYKDQLSEMDILNLIAFIRNSPTSDKVQKGSLMTRAGAAKEAANGEESSSASKPEPDNTLAVGALREENPVLDATATNRHKNLAVGAIAAEGKQ